METKARHAFYRGVAKELRDAKIPFLVGGAYAMRRYADVRRDTKDLDLFLERGKSREVVRFLSRRGYAARIVSPHWLGKVSAGDAYVDLIFGSRNGICAVDRDWFRHAESGRLLGLPVRWVPPEEMVWSKAFVMARDRFDGADIAQLVRARGKSLNWTRLLDRFGSHWPVLFVHLVLFGYTFPSEHGAVPAWVLEELDRRRHETPQNGRKLCRGTLLSPGEYLDDIRRRGYVDARQRDAAREN
ncbi:MAG TPA: hypothetical protein VF950_24930 [Planctomycetota bacterium]